MNPSSGTADTLRALLVHTDAAFRRYVRMVMDEFALAVTEFDSASLAAQHLTHANKAHGPLSLLLADAGDPGCAELLTAMQVPGAAGAAVKVLLMVAGAPPKPLINLVAPHALAVVNQPASAAVLRAELSKALAGLQTAMTSRDHEAAAARLSPDAAAAITTYFEGDRALYDTYREACFAQFPADLEMGRQAVARSDLQTLRRCAHSLKSVLLTLGYQGVSKQAATVESLSHEGHTEAALAGWSAPAESMQQLIRANA